MSLDVMALNARNGFGNENHAAALLALTEELDPDIAVFPEAFAGKSPLRDHVPGAFTKMGYHVVHSPNSLDGRTDVQSMLLIARETLLDSSVPVETHNLVGRAAIAVTLRDATSGSAMSFLGVHFEDRNEPTRLMQAALLKDLAPQVAFGDFNSLQDDRRLNRIVASRPIRAAANHLPRSVRSHATRLCEMADGRTMARLLDTFEDADQDGQPTYPARLPLFQLDRILVSPAVTVEEFQVRSARKASDHRATTAKLSVKQ
jgi:endonuclease/exonuclease/phosphatase family metal-dependent hydrolase